MEEVLTDDQSHYEISLTAGQAFVAFVLLLLSLAASFAFGLLIGRGQTDEHLVMRKDAPVVSEAAATPATKKVAQKAAEVTNDDFKAPPPTIAEKSAEAGISPPVPAKTGTHTAVSTIAESSVATGASPAAGPARAPAPTLDGPAYAQLLSTSDQKTAEALAAKLIEAGYTAAYVERTTTEKGTIFRVRIKFLTDAEAHSAEAKLKQFSKEVWITK